MPGWAGGKARLNRTVREALTDGAHCEPDLEEPRAQTSRRQEWVRPRDRELSVQGGNGPAGTRTARTSAWPAHSDGQGRAASEVTGARVGLSGPCGVWLSFEVNGPGPPGCGVEGAARTRRSFG